MSVIIMVDRMKCVYVSLFCDFPLRTNIDLFTIVKSVFVPIHVISKCLHALVLID